MTFDRTELEWAYEPSDFFEVPYLREVGDFKLLIADGRVVASVTVPIHPVPSALEDRVKTLIESIFLFRRLNVRRRYRLEGPTIYQHASGKKNVTIRLRGIESMAMIGQVDVILADAEGKVVRDSKAERIAEQTSLLDDLAPKVERSTTLRNMLNSYSQLIADPDDALIHLYGIRGALSQHYRNDGAARTALDISKRKWDPIGILANVEPLNEGCHRGDRTQGNRPATSAEMDEARGLARQWIIAFAQTV